MSSAAVNAPQAPAADPFHLAISEFLKKLPAEEQAICRQAAGLEALLEDVVKLDEEDRARSKSRRFMEKLQPTLKCLQGFGKSLDVLSNAKPEALCVLWGGIRIILHLATSFFEYFEKTLRMFTQIGDCLHRFQTYARLYSQSQHLSDALVRSYGHILDFIWGCRDFFLQAKRDKASFSGHVPFLKKVWKTLKTQQDSICDHIRQDIDLVEREASAVEKEEAQAERQEQRTERRAQQERWNDTNLFHKEVRKSTTDDEMDKILKWLSAPDPSTNHDNACRKRQGGTGSWFVDGPDFSKWRTEAGYLLWLHGTAGAGKTVLCSNAIEQILVHCQSVSDSQCIHFYFDFRDQRKQTHGNVLASLLSQLLRANAASQKPIYDLYIRKDEGRQQPRINELEETLQSVIKLTPKTYLILDALDECTDREALLPFLQSLVGQAVGNLNVLVLSRREEDIEHALNLLFKHQVCLESSLVSSDIRIYVEDRLKSDYRFFKWPPELRNEVSEMLVQKANGMFQWAACQVAELQKCASPRLVRDVIASMPRTLDDTYERMLIGIPNIYARDAARIFQWMVFSARPLAVEEVSEILAFDPDRSPPLDAQGRLFDPKQLLSILSDLTTISTTKDWRTERVSEKKMEVMAFSHYSVQEYLCSDRISTGRMSRFNVTQELAAYSIAKFCLTYLLQFDQADSLTPETYETYPLARYAAQYWAKHAREYEIGQRSLGGLQPLIEQLFDDANHPFLNWQRIYEPVTNNPRDCTNTEWYSGPHTPLICASALGLVDSVVGLISNADDANFLSADRFSPLGLAVRNGHIETVQRLIWSGADVNLFSRSGWWELEPETPLCISAHFGHKEVLHVLLENGADVNGVKGGHDTTALSLACERGHLNIVRTLIEKGAFLDGQNANGETALMIASGKDDRNLATIELLLNAGANVNWSDGHGKSALSSAVKAVCKSGRNSPEGARGLQVMQALLEKGANPNTGYGAHKKSLLLRVVEARNLEATSLLLAHGAEVNVKSAHGVTPLGVAAEKNDSWISQLLLAQGADVNVRNEAGIMPLMFAAHYNNQSIAQQLLDKGADAMASSLAQKTAISFAAAAGHEDMVRKILLHMDLTGPAAEKWVNSARLFQAIKDTNHVEMERLLSEGGDTKLTGLRGATLLHLAAEYGDESIILTLLGNNPDIEARDASGRTALDIATSQGHEGVVRRLLENRARTESEWELKMHEYNYHLPKACEMGNENIVRMLLDYGAFEPSTLERGLDKAAKNGHHSIVRILLEEVLRLSNPTESYIQNKPFDMSTPLALADQRGPEEAVVNLLEKGAEADNDLRFGDMALSAAAYHGHEEIVRLLLEAGANPRATDSRGKIALHDVEDQDGVTALHLAAVEGLEKIVRLLLEAGAEPNVEDQDGTTALHLAAMRGLERIVRLLLEARADPNTTNVYGRTPLGGATYHDCNEGTVRLLLEAGADPSRRAKNGTTPLSIALTKGSMGAARIMREYMRRGA